MNKFIYVFSEDARDKLLARGLTVLKSDEKNHIYIFANSDKFDFATSDISVIFSNTLSF